MSDSGRGFILKLSHSAGEFTRFLLLIMKAGCVEEKCEINAGKLCESWQFEAGFSLFKLGELER